MRELKTVQSKEKLNKVFAIDEKGNGGANHCYVIACTSDDNELETCLKLSIPFQNGARLTEDSTAGALDCDLLEIVKDRLIAFQEGPFKSEYNQHALEHIEKALCYMNKRVEDRIARNVLGKNKK